ncbi:transcription-repair coupling factor [Anaerosinus massiliensis]|uniref:transcription-repair coupling factor n=1 Tax=Massilibacillus massiliensis TaxID=1806837 RepID=UPI000AAFAA2A|nr:transcription-repair coupling factor [Massilibacillus massiliensis]
MEKLFELLTTDPAITRVVDCFGMEKEQSLVYGLSGSQKAAVLAASYNQHPRTTVIITSNHASLEVLKSDLEMLLPAVSILELPALDLITFSAAAKSIELAAKRMDVLGRLIRKEKMIVLATAAASIQKGLSKLEFERSSLNITMGMEIERDEILEKLVQLGYERVEQVDSLGKFSARGGILDIFPINSQAPIRVEFFDNEIDSLREFDINSQRSIENITNVDVLPLFQMDSDGKPAMFLSYLEQTATIIFDEPTRIREQMTMLVKENPELKKRMFNWNDITSIAKNKNVLYISLLLQKYPYTEPNEIISVTAKAAAPFHKQMEILSSEIKSWKEHKMHVVLFMTNEQKAMSMLEILKEHQIAAEFQPELKALVEGLVLVTVGTLVNGFELPQAHIAVITEKDVFGRQKKKALPRVAKAEKITYFRDINIGDYVVHVNHGIGKYVGVETLDVAGIHRDYLHIRYGGDDKLFVPTDQVHLLQKYIGSEGDVPRLHKMGGNEWNKAKSKAKAAVADIAKELIKLYAQRQIETGYAFESDTPWQKEFEEAFPYEETADQIAAIAEIKADMEKPRPMDRLLCGDVGFGKTEVAIRAAFKAVMSGRQVAVLVPTTVLAQQHYQTFKSRFAGFGPVVDVICRFRTAKQQKHTLEKVKTGQVDVLIGTHSILNANNVQFKDLGLLIVDEEQRFGVAQKEKIKKLSKGIDVLTLSATPIPRTLHMSLVGARDMSIIETPPEERFPVQTYVVENNDEIMRDAIKRELKRSGQVYFVYNRVETIDKMSSHLAKMLPDAKIQTGHGQMPEELLEQVMLDFYEGKDDILVATSIIENGLDVANANTIIVYDADRFGLSQLYQMRGRVGRSNHMAFAYFVYQADKVLTEVAEKRLQAIKEFAELGAGFKIAMRDLEIRGAGNLLGAQQHGHIATVGFEMYCRLLEEAVQGLKSGEEKPIVIEPVLELNVEAYLPGDYIEDAMHKIEVYQRIAAVRNQDHLQDLLDELIDRFGEPPEAVTNLLAVAEIKNTARTLGLQSIIQRPAKIEFTFSEHPNIEVEGILKLKDLFGGFVKIIAGPPEVISLKLSPNYMKKVLEFVKKVLKTLALQDRKN